MSDLLLRRRAMMASVLPSGYTWLSYIESHGTEYVRTGIVQSTSFLIDCSALVFSDNVIRFAVATYNSSSYNLGFGQYQGSVAGFNAIPFDGTRREFAASYGDGSGYLKNFTVNGELQGDITSYNINGNEEITLLGSGASTRYLYAKLYGCKIYNGNVLVADHIPALRNYDQVYGLYDTVTKTFLTNAGSGAFTGQ